MAGNTTMRVDVNNTHRIVAEGSVLDRIVHDPQGGIGSLGDTSNLASSDDITENLSDSNENLKEINSTLKSILSTITGRGSAGGVGGAGRITPDNARNGGVNESTIAGMFSKGAEGIASTFDGFLTGDGSGGFLNGLSNVGGIVSAGAKLASGISASAVAALAGAGAAIGAGVLTIKGLGKLAGKTNEVLPEMDNLQAVFTQSPFDGTPGGGISDLHGTRLGSAILQMNQRSDLVSRNINTGLTNEEFISLVTDLGKQGVTDSNVAAESVGRTARMAYGLGMDVKELMPLTSYLERYGTGSTAPTPGNTTSDYSVLNNLYMYGRTTGLTRGQMSEFFSGLESALENSLSKGFVKDTQKLAYDIATVSNLSSDKVYWQGTNGINRYISASNAMGNATSLSSTSNMLMYQAMKKTHPELSWMEIMQKLEEGDFGDIDFLVNYRETLSNSYGKDKDSIISDIKQSFGTNWHGANEIYDVIFNGIKEVVEDDVTKLIIPDNVSELARQYNEQPEAKSNYLDALNAQNATESAWAGAGVDSWIAKTELFTKAAQGVAESVEKLTKAIDDFIGAGITVEESQ